MRHLLTGAATALALAMPAYAQDAAAPADAGTVLAVVNGTDITLGHLVALRGRLPEEYQSLPDEVLLEGMLEQLIQQQAVVDAIETTPSLTLGVENETRAYLAGREIERLSNEPVDEDAVQAAYDEAYGAAPAEPEYNASHILVETEEEAAAIVEELAGGADFATVAQELSTGPSGPNGGSLGWFGPGMMVPEFEEAVVTLEPGEVSAPVQTQFGWHVIRLDDLRDQEKPALEAVRPQIEAQVRQAAVEAELARLLAAAEVVRTEAEVDPAAIRDDTLLGN